MVKMKDGEANESCPTSLAPSDCSFVVLENPSLVEVGGPELPHSVSFPSTVDISVRHPQLNGQAESYMVESIVSNFTPEELQKRLQEVYRENLELKEMLSQNNLAMKNQLATLLAWQTQVKDVFQQHGEKFTETGALIHKLRAENSMLKNLVEEQKNHTTSSSEANKMEELLKAENTELKRSVQQLTQALGELRARPARESPSPKEVELMSLLKQVNEMLESTERARRQLEVDVERLEAQRSRLERDVDQLKTRLAEEQRDTALLREQISAAAASKQDQPSAEEAALRRQVAELRGQCDRLTSENEEMCKQLASLRSSLQSKEKQSSAYMEVQSQGFQEKLDRLTAQLVEREEALARANSEVAGMKEAVAKLRLENEGLDILKAQVEVYQLDFNAEREGRERLAGELDRQVEELNLLRRANQELTKELAAAKSSALAPVSPAPQAGSGWNTIAAPSRQVRRPSPARQDAQDAPRALYEEDVPPPRRYECPLCNQVFQLYDHLQHHVETCIN